MIRVQTVHLRSESFCSPLRIRTLQKRVPEFSSYLFRSSRQGHFPGALKGDFGGTAPCSPVQYDIEDPPICRPGERIVGYAFPFLSWFSTNNSPLSRCS